MKNGTQTLVLYNGLISTLITTLYIRTGEALINLAFNYYWLICLFFHSIITSFVLSNYYKIKSLIDISHTLEMILSNNNY